MPNPYTFIPNALPQGQMQRIYAEVGNPAPTSFADPMILMSPDWSPDIPLTGVTEWPADHGSELPVVGDQVLLEQDSRGFWRVASWGHPTTLWGGVTLPIASPSGAGQSIVTNGAGGSSWGTPTIAPLTWSPLPYNTTNWQDYGVAPWQVGQYAKDTMGWVHVRGLLKSAAAYSFSIASTLVIATLPTGFRPGGNEIFDALQVDSANDRSLERVDINTAGQLLVNGGQTSALDVLSTGAGNSGTALYFSLKHMMFQQVN